MLVHAADRAYEPLLGAGCLNTHQSHQLPLMEIPLGALDICQLGLLDELLVLEIHNSEINN